MNTLFLVATWKAWTVPILCVIGIIGFLFRGLMDMAENWETGYGEGSRRAMIQAFSWPIVFVLAALCIGLFAGCSVSADEPAKNARWGLKNRFEICPDNVQRIADHHPDLLNALKEHPDLMMDCLQTIAVLDEQSGNMKGKK